MSFVTDMYFLDARSLALELRKGTFSEYRTVKHLVTSFVLGGFGFSIPLTATFENPEHPLRDAGIQLTVFIVVGVITYYGTWLTYNAHRKGDGRDYFLRFAALSLPIGVRLTLLFFGIMVGLMALTALLASRVGPVAQDIFEIMYVFATFTFAAMFFLRMRTYLAVAGAENDTTAV